MRHPRSTFDRPGACGRRLLSPALGVAAAAAAAGALLGLAGCNAAGDPLGPEDVQGGISRGLRVTLNWPDRTRQFDGPRSANFARITLVGANPAGGDLSFVAERPDGRAGGSQQYTEPLTARNGDYTMRVEWFADREAAGGNPVGRTAESEALVRVLPENAEGIADVTPGGFINPGADGGIDDILISRVVIASPEEVGEVAVPQTEFGTFVQGEVRPRVIVTTRPLRQGQQGETFVLRNDAGPRFSVISDSNDEPGDQNQGVISTSDPSLLAGVGVGVAEIIATVDGVVSAESATVTVGSESPSPSPTPTPSPTPPPLR